MPDDWKSLCVKAIHDPYALKDLEQRLIQQKTEAATSEFLALVDEIVDWIASEQAYHFKFPKAEFLEILKSVDGTRHGQRAAFLKVEGLTPPSDSDIEWEKFLRGQARSQEEHARRETEKRERLQRQEAAIKAAEARERALQAQRTAELAALASALEEDYLRARDQFLASDKSILTRDEINSVCVEFVTDWFERRQIAYPSIYAHMPDDEQVAAIASGNENLLLVARAGSGKTGTIINRVDFLVHHCGVNPSEILILAFNKKAVLELRERLLMRMDPSAEARLADLEHSAPSDHSLKFATDRLRDRIARVCDENDVKLPHVMTFHALAYRITQPEENLVFDDFDADNETQSRLIQTVIDEHLRDRATFEQMRKVMLAHFRTDWERIIQGGYNLNPDELVNHRRSLPRESLRGEFLKSRAEKIIADFLFENGVAYNYESSFRWSDFNYRPDFRIRRSDGPDIILEYFGLVGDPDYDEQSQAKRMFWRSRSDFEFAELSPRDWDARDPGTLQVQLQQLLEKHQVPLRKLSDDEIWAIVKNRAVDRFTSAVKQFIGRCRSAMLDPQSLEKQLNSKDIGVPSLKWFWCLAGKIYVSYLDRLSASGSEDFQGLLIRAANSIASAQTLFRSAKEGSGNIDQIRFVMIDEFQDFSPLFHQLLDKIRARNSDVSVFCVGDDWQAINGFSGATLEAFDGFKDYFGNDARILTLAKNYRSAAAIVAFGNAIMKGRGEEGIAQHSHAGSALVADLDAFDMSESEKIEFTPNGEEFAAILRIAIDAVTRGKKVLILSRLRDVFDPDAGRPKNLDSFLNRLREYFPKEDCAKIQISTTHRSKGLEEDVVIVLGAIERYYPLVHPQWVFTSVLGDTLDNVILEERRLFYVAATRAKSEVYFLTRSNEQSPFLKDAAQSSLDVKTFRWKDYPPVSVQGKYVVVAIGNAPGKGPQPTKALREDLAACGYTYASDKWNRWQRVIPRADFDFNHLKQEPWAKLADGVEVRIGEDFSSPEFRYHIDCGTWTSQ